MGDKYNALKKDVYLDSTYQLLVNPRNKRIEKLGCVSYNVVSSYLVERDSKKKCVQYLYDTDEWCVLTDNTKDDTWACTTTDLINTINTAVSDEKLLKQKQEELKKQNLLKVINSL